VHHTRRVIGIAGASGSGKTSLARALVAALGPGRSTPLSHDDYYRPLTPAQRAAVHQHDFDAPSALDNALLAAHLDALRRGQDVDVPVYAFDVHDRVGARAVPARDVIVVDGILLLAVPELRAALDLAVFVETPLELCLSRRVARDVAERGRTPEGVHAQWAATVAPAWERHVAPSRSHAHVVVDGTKPLDGAVEALIARLSADSAAAPPLRAR
jgi:uridine kinase